jgi:hypothetical protein
MGEQPAFVVNDSGERLTFKSGMQREPGDKVLFDLVFSGPMLERWAVHLTKGAAKYAPDNWMKANSEEEYLRFRQSAARHFVQLMRGDTDEDHYAAVFFNLNGMAYVRARLDAPK